MSETFRREFHLSAIHLLPKSQMSFTVSTTGAAGIQAGFDKLQHPLNTCPPTAENNMI
jgi:hypothetical protein